MTNPHIVARINKKIEKLNKQHSSFWMGDEAEDMLRTYEDGSPEHLNRLRGVQRSISNFVEIVTGKNIPVIFSSGKMSYTDGNTVVISADLDPMKFDVQVGLALHEASHCKLSLKSLAFLNQLKTIDAFMSLVKHTTLIADAAAIGVTPEQVRSLVFMTMNVIEDRRIDLFMYQNASGYRPYYEALYDEYWHSADIDNSLRDPKFRKETVENYMLFLINLTNKYWDVNALKGLAEIRSVVKLTPEYLDSLGDNDPRWQRWGTPLNVNKDALPGLFADAVKIVGIILKNSTEYSDPNAKPEPGQEGDMQMEGDGDGMAGMPNMDFSTPGGKSTKYVPVSYEKFKEALKRQLEFLDHKSIEADKKSLSDKVNQMLRDFIESKSEISMVDVDYLGKIAKCPVTVYKQLTKKIVMSSNFPMGRHGAQNQYAIAALSEGIQMGQILAHRIQVAQDESQLIYTRQANGRLDKRLIAGLGYGYDNVFHQIMAEPKEPVTVWLDIDLSGSMQGNKFKNAMKVAIAIAYASEKNRKMHCVIALRSGAHKSAALAILYNSKINTFGHLRSIVPYIDAVGSTPEALCFGAVKEEILNLGNGRKYFINISDGEPTHGFEYNGQQYNYSGKVAFTHTRLLMKEFKDAGIEVLSYFVSDGGRTNESSFREMYGSAAKFVDVDSVTSISSTINKIMLNPTT